MHAHFLDLLGLKWLVTSTVARGLASQWLTTAGDEIGVSPTKAENGEEQVPKGIWELVVDDGEMGIADVIKSDLLEEGLSGFKLFCLQLTAQNMLAHTSTCTVHTCLNQFHKAILLFTTYNALCYFSILFSPPHPTPTFKTCWLKSTNLISNPLTVRVSSLEMLSGALMKV